MSREVRLAAVALAACAAVIGLAVVAAQLQSAVTERDLGGYSTSLEGRNSAQLHNIRRAARILDGSTVLPGKEFSLAKTLDGRPGGEGWRPAAMLTPSGVEEAAAGGVCQVSSTLYNAALASRMDILERVAHSRPVASVPPGRDATVARGIADLRFRNSRKLPVRISARTEGDRLTVSIRGAGRAPAAARLTTEERRLHGKLVVSVWRSGQGGERELVSRDEYETPAN